MEVVKQRLVKAGRPVVPIRVPCFFAKSCQRLVIFRPIEVIISQEPSLAMTSRVFSAAAGAIWFFRLPA
ncbi:MAG: hypothetical protein EBZ83_05625, partial [Verrucomicrobia bacterium]|nr:hypothetical protein [Verrucomicrobiota bacterium]